MKSIVKEEPFRQKPLPCFATLLCQAIICGVSCCLFGQAVSRQLTLPRPEQIKVGLMAGTQSNRRYLSKILRLAIPSEARHGAGSDVPCAEFDSVKITYTTMLPPDAQAVLEVYSRSCQYDYLIALKKAGPEGWEYIQTIPLWVRDRKPQVSFESLIRPGAKEIVVRNQETDYGTGIFQTNITIWNLYPDGLRVIFNEPEHVVFNVPVDREEKENTEQSEDSQFNFIAPKAGKAVPSSARQILQRQTIRDHGTTITRWWLYVWDPHLLRFSRFPTWR